jgi:phosphoglycerate dehydrogenase-like enzyme
MNALGSDGVVMLRIVIPDDEPPVMAQSQAYRKLLEQSHVDYHDSLPGSEEVLIERIAGAEIVINIRSSTSFSETVFRRAPNLRLLSLWGTGTDNVDLGAAARHGVTVTNTPGVSAFSVAEHALALLLAVARRIPRVDAEVRQGRWPRGHAAQVHGKTLGIVGLGAVGRQFARLGAGIGMHVKAWTMHPGPALGFELVSLDELFRQSDVVSLHLRLSADTRGFIGARELGKMKPSAILINTARGPIVDQEALLDALTSDRIAGAGLDVFDVEPLPPGHPLTHLDNVVLTPHSAGITPEVLEAGLQLSIDNVWNFVGGHPTNVVVGRDGAR